MPVPKKIAINISLMHNQVFRLIKVKKPNVDVDS